MKFELEPYHRNISDDSFLNDMRKVASKLGKATITTNDYNKEGEYCSSTIIRHFGSWFIALEKAGLEKSRSPLNIPVDECILDLVNVAKKLRKNSVTQKEYRLNGKYSPQTLIKRLGTWFNALEKAGLKRTRNFGITDYEYFLNIEQVWRKLGRQPHYSDMRKPLSKYCGGAYEYRWGSWRKALEAFIAFINEEDKYISNIKQKMVENSNDHAITDIDKKEPCCKKVTRTISVRLRFIVMKRDSFKCRLCGASPALKPGLVLHVDHIKPLSKGGDTVLENLQTLCDKCNIGKSDLPLDF